MENLDTDKIIKYAGESKQQVIDSRDVARMIGKTHRHLMRDIRGYINDMKDSPKLDSPKFFIESSYISSQNKELPCYLLTKQGCEFVANKLGVKRDADMSYRDRDGAWRYFPEALKVFQDNALEIQDDDLGL